MDRKKVIEALNAVISLEHAAVMQYQQHSLLVRGLRGKEYEGFFRSQSKDSLEHAYKFGRKVVALGGTPTIEMGAPILQSHDLKEMLEQDLQLEQAALGAYMEAHALAEGDLPLRITLENQIEAEQQDIEDLQMYLGVVETEDRGAETGLRRVG